MFSELLTYIYHCAMSVIYIFIKSQEQANNNVLLMFRLRLVFEEGLQDHVTAITTVRQCKAMKMHA